jgi:hypothetical protein
MVCFIGVKLNLPCYTSPFFFLHVDTFFVFNLFLAIMLNEFVHNCLILSSSVFLQQYMGFMEIEQERVP